MNVLQEIIEEIDFEIHKIGPTDNDWAGGIQVGLDKAKDIIKKSIGKIHPPLSPTITDVCRENTRLNEELEQITARRGEAVEALKTCRETIHDMSRNLRQEISAHDRYTKRYCEKIHALEARVKELEGE